MVEGRPFGAICSRRGAEASNAEASNAEVSNAEASNAEASNAEVSNAEASVSWEVGAYHYRPI
jgi:hypothetical protein